MIENKISFKNSWTSLPRTKVRVMRDEIMSGLNITTKQAFYKRLDGRVIPRTNEAQIIEHVYKKHGFDTVWD